jgi:hypothetical protein
MRLAWHGHRDGRRAIRSECAACGNWCGAVPLTPENMQKADAAQPAAGLLDALTLAEDEGVDLVLVGGRVEARPWQGASRKLRELVRQSQHALLRHLRAGCGG